MTPATTIQTNKPPATPKCGLNQPRTCRVKSETPQFWVDPTSYETQTDTASDTGLTITLTAEPTELRFYPGDQAATGIETTITCQGPGLAWQQGMADTDTDCRHFWDWPSKWDPTGQFITHAEADYNFTWTATGTLAPYLPATTGTLGTTTITSPNTPITVTEIQAVLD